ncbi:MAG: metalloregulator ArsR/SmtB family transcription factor [Pseudonocardia sp.]|uniref:metalloregulator ArsR/SmtB family transcription factor n=1 Tax=unclassified Pseudonocardia TaxID=2619320 RepID=UPI00086914AE|nr:MULTISPECIES: metalloregulator ArsR/SmtB family transcription factor [unclassified Pseudonocardia]MBN9111569.1 metalloregulator ArsR/SmtB family transcription factor [Pseudonocardia sp.]ODU98215.1 MAG: ArsR family transcriptional regulator [Pseudonocardia sp. SCN 73-27]
MSVTTGRAELSITDVSTTTPGQLGPGDAKVYAEWFACLADATRVRLLHAVAAGGREITVGELTNLLGISQSTCSHHVRKLADVGFVTVRRDGNATLVAVNPACCTGLPHAADIVMGLLAPRPCCPEDLPDDVTVRAMTDADWADVRRIYAEGIATGDATFETDVPDRRHLDRTWLPDHRWIAELDGDVVGWTALSPVSVRPVYAGVAESSIYVADGHRGRGVGKALIHRQVCAADDASLWTLQTSIFPENRASLALHHSAGYRTLGVRERIGQRDGHWRDTVFLERRRAADLA